MCYFYYYYHLQKMSLIPGKAFPNAYHLLLMNKNDLSSPGISSFLVSYHGNCYLTILWTSILI